MSLIVKYDGNMNVISRLLREYRIKKNLSYEQFQNIVKVLMKYVEKDKHTEGLVEILFVQIFFLVIIPLKLFLVFDII